MRKQRTTAKGEVLERAVISYTQDLLLLEELTPFSLAKRPPNETTCRHSENTAVKGETCLETTHKRDARGNTLQFWDIGFDFVYRNFWTNQRLVSLQLAKTLRKTAIHRKLFVVFS